MQVKLRTHDQVIDSCLYQVDDMALYHAATAGDFSKKTCSNAMALQGYKREERRIDQNRLTYLKR